MALALLSFRAGRGCQQQVREQQRARRRPARQAAREQQHREKQASEQASKPRGRACLATLPLSPVRIDWSMRSVEERSWTTRVSAGTLPPTPTSTRSPGTRSAQGGGGPDSGAAAGAGGERREEGRSGRALRQHRTAGRPCAACDPTTHQALPPGTPSAAASRRIAAAAHPRRAARSSGRRAGRWRCLLRTLSAPQSLAPRWFRSPRPRWLMGGGREERRRGGKERGGSRA